MGEVANKNDQVLKYFVLPLYDMSFKMIEDVYKAMYLSQDGKNLFIQLKGEPQDLPDNMLFSGVVPIGRRVFNVYHTNEIHLRDIQLMIEGKYSKISANAKNKIISLSGLDYKKISKDGKREITSPLLGALTKHPAYRQMLEKKLGVELHEDKELVSKLNKESFIENIINQE